MITLKGPHIDKLMALFEDAEHSPGGIYPWWIYAARQAFLFEHHYFIPNRNSEDLYLARFWLSKPVEVSGRDHDTQCRWTSRDSVLLHYITGPDDDAAVHSHPWGFRSLVLGGGFVEREPDKWWKDYRSHCSRRGWDIPGPTPAEEVMVFRNAGDDYYSPHDRMHRIVEVKPNTWTMVRTDDNPGNSAWGFHPPGKPFQHWRDFLGLNK